MKYICYNGSFLDASKAVIRADDKSYRYGDGFFETIKVVNGNIVLATYHEQRIKQSLSLLQYSPAIDTDILFSEINELCIKNNCADHARVRVSFSAGNGNLLDFKNQQVSCLIEATALEQKKKLLYDNGLITGIFNDMKKSCGRFANIKSASSMIYSIAARQCLQNNWDDGIILNERNNICESCIANIFWVKDEKIYTPPLSEGCVDGVMRRYLIDNIKTIEEATGTKETLVAADEIFLTNAIRGIRWVRKMDDIIFTNNVSHALLAQFIHPLHY